MTGPGLVVPADGVLVGAALVAASTVGGVLLSRWVARRPVASSLAVSVVLLVVVLGDLVPDVRGDLAESGTQWWTAVVAAVVGFAATGALVRTGCGCVPRPGAGPPLAGSEVAGGAATATAIGVHRALEGAVLALVTSVPVVAALVVHAAGEGFALGALLARSSRRSAAAWLLIACLSPLLGATLIGPLRLPETVTPLVTSFVVGTLSRIALLALGLAATRQLAARAVRVLDGSGSGLVEL
jgi:zinc transporter ZupT